MPVVSAEVYTAAYGGPSTVLDKSWRRSWTDPLSDAGGFALNVQNIDADLATCSFGRVVRFSVDGAAAFAGIIESKTVHSVSPGEESDEYTEVKGRGTMALADSFVVFPEIIDNPLLSDTRYFTWASTLFDDSGWALVSAVDLETVEQFGPVNWPSATTKKIRPGGSPIVTHTPEEFGVRRTFTTTGSDRTYRLFFTGDDGVDIFVDGVRLVADVRPGMWQETRQVDVRLYAGTHYIAIKGTNLDFPAPNYSWVVAALYELGSDGTLVSLVVQTDATWVGAQFASTPPGFTPGAVLALLRSEAIARGVSVPALDFSATVDTAGTPWPVAPDISFRIGTKGLGALLQLAETYCDLAMDPATLTLRAWVKGAKGGPTAAVFTPGTNIMEMSHEVSG